MSAGLRQSTKLTSRPFQKAARPPSLQSCRTAPAMESGLLEVVMRVANVSKGKVIEMLAQPPSVRSTSALAPAEPLLPKRST
mmetsp:Transcript_70980/g.179652  ORF Transcript_70980/g.179652 Transcript_70980/m.179652 type:complete len:82 (-) Transcript_70980:135-380(-)